ncbi:RsmB/NOP family class I SAM-dependent RNA methyltransferase [Sphingobacterium corticis]|uniref:RsmB/NOP family class I SAM-dependent RNA methyltransferase n=1 Tax=Sphingobacterium corticis TaxID=1812823 RepID=A0ABW5NNL2_9SPHI
MGSTDRRMTSRLCYNYFRLGNALSGLEVEERLLIAEFLCEESSSLIAVRKPEWNDLIANSLSDKIGVVEKEYGKFVEDIFPNKYALSKQVEAKAFAQSHLIQPKLFIRAKRTHYDELVAILKKVQAPFELLEGQTIAFPNGFNVGGIKQANGWYEVQDFSSQQTADLLNLEADQKWWDCCAASGGKSLMMLDQCPDINLTVSDVRLSILINLEERFEIAGIKANQYRKKILDLSQPVDHIMRGETFDGILVDAPCSGSGTWGRTPEMLLQFDPASIDHFHHLQYNIIKNVLPYLKTGGQLLYITCSVFAAENESVVDRILKDGALELIDQKPILGYDRQADSMYVASFRKK